MFFRTFVLLQFFFNTFFAFCWFNELCTCLKRSIERLSWLQMQCCKNTFSFCGIVGQTHNELLLAIWFNSSPNSGAININFLPKFISLEHDLNWKIYSFFRKHSSVFHHLGSQDIFFFLFFSLRKSFYIQIQNWYKTFIAAWQCINLSLAVHFQDVSPGSINLSLLFFAISFDLFGWFSFFFHKRIFPHIQMRT